MKNDRLFNNKRGKKRPNFNRKQQNDETEEQQQEESEGNHQETSFVEQDHDIPDSITPYVSESDRLYKPKRFKNLTNQSKRLIIILERANLECVKAKQNFELLNTDDHQGFIKKYHKNPMFCRPDILHQCLLMLFDSPLNRAGLLQVFIHSENNVLIEINPQTRFPRTFKRFANLMVQLLHKLSIKAADTSDKLLQVIKNPVTDHLPVGCKKYGTSFKSSKLVTPKELVPSDDTPVAFVIGAMAHGAVNVDYIESEVSISQYPLSAALACTKICSAFEEAWGIQ